RGHGHRDTTPDRGLPRGDLPGAGLQHVPHDDVVDLLAGHAGFLQRGLDRQAAQVHGLPAFQRPGQLADRRPGACDDYRTRHDNLQCESAYFFFGRYRSVMVPSNASAARAVVSESVGCGWMVSARSAASAPISIAWAISAAA